MDRAMARYLNLEYTLSRAAQYAGVMIREIARAAIERGIPFFRYSLEELRKDRERARTWVKREDSRRNWRRYHSLMESTGIHE